MDSFLGRRRPYERSSRYRNRGPIDGQTVRARQGQITRSDARQTDWQTERDTVSWPRVGASRCSAVGQETRDNTQLTETHHWDGTMLVCRWHVFVWQPAARAACRTCSCACASLRSRAVQPDWPLIDRSYTRFDSRARVPVRHVSGGK